MAYKTNKDALQSANEFAIWGVYPFDNVAANDWAFATMVGGDAPRLAKFNADSVSSQQLIIACAAISVASCGQRAILGNSSFLDDWLDKELLQLPWISQHGDLLRQMDEILKSSLLRSVWTKRGQKQLGEWLKVSGEIREALAKFPKCGRSKSIKCSAAKLKQILGRLRNGHENVVTTESDSISISICHLTAEEASAIGYQPELFIKPASLAT